MTLGIKLAWLALSIPFASLLVVIYWLFATFSPVLTGTFVLVEESSVVAGHSVTVTSDICKHKDETATLIRTFNDEIIYNIPILVSNAPTGCANQRYTLEIPHNLPPDTYTLKTEFIYQTNPLVEQTYEYESNEFKVTKE